MPNTTVKNIPDNVYERLKASAKAHRRSINGEIIACLERQFMPCPVSVPDLLAKIRRERDRLDDAWTVDEIQRAIDDGRS